MKNVIRKLMILLTIALTFQTGLGNYITPTTFAATGPVLTVTGGSASFVAGDNALSAPVAIDSGITITADSSTTLASATVAVTGNLHVGEDVLIFINDGRTMGNITASYNASTGLLTLTSAGGTAALEQWQAALRSITYTDTAIKPNTATRTVSFTVTDGVNTSSTATRTVTVSETDQTPIVTTNGGSTAYTAGTMGTTLDAGVTISDLDNGTLASARVSIGSGFQSGDVLAYTNNVVTMGNITASYNASTGVLTLTSSGATATLAQWQSALRGITFSSTSATPGQRIISYAVSDGIKTSAAATHTMEVTVIAPLSLTTSSGSASFVAGDNAPSTPVAIDSGLTITADSSTTLASATVAITGNPHVGEDVLIFINDGRTMGNITASYNAVTGVLTLTSSGETATLEQWQAALRSITYTDTAITPITATRTVSFTVTDGVNTSSAATRTVTVTATDQTPIVTTSGGSTNYISGASTPVAMDNGLMISDLDNTTLSSATVSITSHFDAGKDVLAYTNDGATIGNITASYDAFTGVLTLTSSGATATLAQWQSALRGISFSSTSATPGQRIINYTVNDGTKTSAAATHTVKVTVIMAPSLTTSSGSASFVAGDNVASTPVAIDPGITVSADSSTTLASATVAITGNFHAGEDVLSFINGELTMGNITASYDAATGVLTLTSAGATGTLAQWQSVLRSITYTDTAITPNTATRTVSFTVTDGVNVSNTATRIVTVAATNQTPIVTTSGGSTNYISGNSTTSTPVAIDGGLTVSDLDNETLASATVSITSHFDAGKDVLAYMNDGKTMGNITATYDALMGMLTLTSAGGTATLAQWQNALQAVTYNNTSVSPNTATRTISFTVSDGTKVSSIATKSVTLQALSSLRATPNTLSVLTGQTASVAITAIFSDQAHIDVISSVTWTVQNPAIVNVISGRVTGKTTGSTVVSAVYGTQSVDINVTVTGTPVSGPESSTSSSTNTSSSTTNTSTSIDTSTPAKSNPSTPPAQETKHFHALVETDRLVAFIQDALAGNSVTFQDVASHWASKDILSAARIGIINGYPDGRFRPDASITRAEFSTLLVKAFALRSGSGTFELRDIQNSWARDSIEILASNRVINGYSDGTFRADYRITRAEMVAMISKILIFQDSPSRDAAAFFDVAPQHWAKEIIEVAAKAGILEGKGENRFEPDANLTRAEALTVIMRMLRENPTIDQLLG